jgi:hypothetical protein
MCIQNYILGRNKAISMMSFFRQNNEFRVFLPINVTRLRRSEAKARLVFSRITAVKYRILPYTAGFFTGPYGIRYGPNRNRIEAREGLYGTVTGAYNRNRITVLYGYGGDPYPQPRNLHQQS